MKFSLMVKNYLESDAVDVSKGVTMNEIFEKALDIDPKNTYAPEHVRLAHILNKLGWVKKRIREENSSHYVYFPAEGKTHIALSLKEIKAMVVTEAKNFFQSGGRR